MRTMLALVTVAAAMAPPKPPQRMVEGTRLDIKADKSLDTVFKNNRAWVEKSVEADANYFSRFREGQNPQILWVGCSDARVPANRLMGLDVGDVFVVRNIANQVLNTDMSMMSVVQYAVNVLQIPHIIVCGHYDCGGVRASMQNVDHTPPLENWLRNIRDTYRLHRAELDGIVDITARQRRLVELNVVEQCISLFKTGVVQRRRCESYCSEDSDYTEPRIHAMVYDPVTGFLNQVPMDFPKIFNELKGIYNLYEPAYSRVPAFAVEEGSVKAAADKAVAEVEEPVKAVVKKEPKEMPLPSVKREAPPTAQSPAPPPANSVPPADATYTTEAFNMPPAAYSDEKAKEEGNTDGPRGFRRILKAIF